VWVPIAVQLAHHAGALPAVAVRRCGGWGGGGQDGGHGAMSGCLKTELAVLLRLRAVRQPGQASLVEMVRVRPDNLPQFAHHESCAAKKLPYFFITRGNGLIGL